MSPTLIVNQLVIDQSLIDWSQYSLFLFISQVVLVQLATVTIAQIMRKKGPSNEQIYVKRIIHVHQIGFYTAIYRLITISLVSNISSIAYFTPSRPVPLCFTPPYGIWSTRKLGMSLIITPPTSSLSAASSAVVILRV
jgi:hypothetical protein